MDNLYLTLTAQSFLKWRNCALEEEELQDMYLMKWDTPTITDKERKKRRNELIMIYNKKCQKMYNNYRKICLKTEINPLE
jgi:hypothetical protein